MPNIHSIQAAKNIKKTWKTLWAMGGAKSFDWVDGKCLQNLGDHPITGDSNNESPTRSCDILVGGWALPLWKMMEFVSWDDDIHDIPNMMGKIKFMFQTPNQCLYPCLFCPIPTAGPCRIGFAVGRSLPIAEKFIRGKSRFHFGTGLWLWVTMVPDQQGIEFGKSRQYPVPVFGDGFSPSVGRPEIIRGNCGVSSKGRFSVAISSQPGSLIKSTIDEDKNKTMGRLWEIRLRHVTTQKMKLHDLHGFIEVFLPKMPLKLTPSPQLKSTTPFFHPRNHRARSTALPPCRASQCFFWSARICSRSRSAFSP